MCACVCVCRHVYLGKGSQAYLLLPSGPILLLALLLMLLVRLLPPPYYDAY